MNERDTVNDDLTCYKLQLIIIFTHTLAASFTQTIRTHINCI